MNYPQIQKLLRSLIYSFALVFISHLGLTDARAAKNLTPLEQASLTHHLQAYTAKTWPTTQGIEVEGLMPYNQSLKKLTQYVKTRLPQQYKNIVLKKDHSQLAPQGFYGFEVTSPILKSKKDFKTFLSLLKDLKKKGFIANPLIASIHVHIGFPQAQAHELALLFCTFTAVEKAVYKKFNFVYTRYPHSLFSNKKHQQACFNTFFTEESIKTIWTQGGRRQALNFEALFDHGTVEFRFANSSTSTQYIENVLQFSTSLVQAVRKQKPEFVQFLHQNKHLISEAILKGTNQDYLLSQLNKALGISIDSPPVLHQDLQYWARHLLKSSTSKTTTEVSTAFQFVDLPQPTELIPHLLQISNLTSKNKTHRHILAIMKKPLYVAYLLEHAYEWKQIDEVEQLFNSLKVRASDQDKASDRGYTALMWAVLENLTHAIPMLINKGANVHALENTKYRHSILFYVIQQSVSSKDLMQFFIDQGVDYNYVDGDGFTPLMWASYLNKIDLVEILLKQPNINIDFKGPSGWTAEKLAQYPPSHRPNNSKQIIQLIKKARKCQNLLTQTG